jgi:hypothetical protein
MEHDQTDKINLIIGQTAYTLEEAKQLLTACNNDEIAVIRNYLGTDLSLNKTNKSPESKNQLIYREIRNFMDGCNQQK